jgi:hypothetical protein
VKVAGKFYPLEIEQGEVPETKLSLETSKSQLPRPVQELITLIFDIGNSTPLMLASSAQWRWGLANYKLY